MENAIFRGRMIEEGWGAALGYPGIIPSEAGDEIHGFVFSSGELPVHWDRLDAFEGAGYVRVPAPARLDSGGVDACIYALAGRQVYDLVLTGFLTRSAFSAT